MFTRRELDTGKRHLFQSAAPTETGRAVLEATRSQTQQPSLSSAIDMATLQIRENRARTRNKAHFQDYMGFTETAWARYQTTQNQNDLHMAANLAKEAARLCPTAHPKRLQVLEVVLAAPKSNPKSIELADLCEEVEFAREALQLCAPGYPERHRILDKLATRLRDRFQTVGDPKDLEEALDLHKVAERLCSPSDPARPEILTGFAASLNDQHTVSGNLDTLFRATELLREAIAIGALDDENPHRILGDLGLLLIKGYIATGKHEDLSEAIVHLQKAMEITTIDHEDRCWVIDALASTFQQRYCATRNVEDLDNSIQLHTDALSTLSSPNYLRPLALDKLAHCRFLRYKATRDPVDLNRSLELQREASESCQDHLHLPSFLHNLVVYLAEIYKVTKDASALSEAIQVQERTLRLCRTESDRYRMGLTSLAALVAMRQKATGDPADIGAAVALEEEALGHCPADHPDRSTHLFNLANLHVQLSSNVFQRGDLSSFGASDTLKKSPDE